MNNTFKIRSNAQVHGIYWAAKQAKKQGLNIDTVLKALFNKYSPIQKKTVSK